MPGSADQMLSAVLPPSRRHLLAVAREVTRSSEAWLREYPIVKRPSVTAACGLIAAVAMPCLAIPELELLARWGLWLFAVDDVLDDLDRADEPVAAWVRRFARDLPGDPGDADPLRAALGSIHSDLGRYPLYPALGARWRAGMAGMVRGMLLERDWSRAPLTGQPGYAAYLRNATITIAVLPCTVTAAILAGEPAAIGEFPVLEPMIRTAARCFRLANDLGSEVRERAEGKLNAVSLLQRDYRARGLRDQDAARAARGRLRQICAADRAYLDSAPRTAPAALATMARFLWSHTSFVWNMYQIGDCDALSAVPLQELPL